MLVSREEAHSSNTRRAIPPPPRFQRRKRPHKRSRTSILFWPAMLPLIIVSRLLVNWIFLSQDVYAAPLAPTATPGHNGVQQFLQQGQPSKANQSGFHRPGPNAAVEQTDTGGKHNTPIPSVEPAKMHDLTYALDDSFVLHRPAMQPNSQADKITGTAIPSGNTPLTFCS